MPTLLDIVGVNKPGSVTGSSLVEYLKPDAEPLVLKGSDNIVISELTFLTQKVAAAQDKPDTKDRIISFRANGWHITYFANSGKTYLFNTIDDPLELNDLSKAKPEELKKCLDALKKQDETLIKLGSTVKQNGLKDLSPELRKQLEELGYLR